MMETELLERLASAILTTTAAYFTAHVVVWLGG